jgi:hypothetical protein
MPPPWRAACATARPVLSLTSYCRYTISEYRFSLAAGMPGSARVLLLPLD